MPVDFAAALKHVTNAAQQGDPLAASLLRYHFAIPDANRPTDSQRQAMQLGVETKPTVPAHLNRWLTVEATGIRPNKVTILGANYAAAQAGDSVAMYNVAIETSTGRFAPLNRVQAVHWFRKAAEAGLPEAKCVYGLELMQGQAVAKDVARGYQWVTEAADANVRFALEFLVNLERDKGHPAPSQADLVRYLGKLANQDATYLEAWYRAAKIEAIEAAAGTTPPPAEAPSPP